MCSGSVREQNTLLLSETKYLLSEFIGHNDAPFIYEKVGNRFERFMIDEFQDTSARGVGELPARCCKTPWRSRRRVGADRG